MRGHSNLRMMAGIAAMSMPGLSVAQRRDANAPLQPHFSLSPAKRLIENQRRKRLRGEK